MTGMGRTLFVENRGRQPSVFLFRTFLGREGEERERGSSKDGGGRPHELFY